jgi:hypothetical protein
MRDCACTHVNWRNLNLGVTFVTVVFILGGANLYENGCNRDTEEGDVVLNDRDMMPKCDSEILPIRHLPHT